MIETVTKKRVAWNKGILGSTKGGRYIRTEEQKNRLRTLRVGKKMPQSFCERQSRWMKEHPNSGQFKKGQKPPHTGVRSGKYTISRWHPDYENALKVRTGKCDICEVEENTLKRKLSFDHNHTTNRFRGWLCGRCNFALGLVEDDVNILIKLMKYLHDKR